MNARFKRQLKIVAKTVGTLRAQPVWMRYQLLQKLMGEERAFRDVAERLAGIPGQLGLSTRAAFYQRACQHVGQEVFIGYQTLLSKRETHLADRVYLGRFCILGLVTIESDAKIADGVQILSGRHQHVDQTVRYTPITIGHGAWVGAGAIIMANVGERAIVGAGAVVTQPVPAHAKVAGVPAKPIRAQDPRTSISIAA